MRPSRKHKQAGITLIELAVAILIIGLIAGMIVVTRNTVRSSELQSILSQQQIYTSVVNTFIAEFQSIPGDMPDATQHWAGVSNGNGNGFIAAPTAGAVPSEPYQFWLHLQQADLLPINMTGVNGGAGIVALAGSNVPAGSLANSAWFVGFDLAAIPEAFDVEEGNYFLYGGVQAAGLPIAPILTPDEARSIDVKSDNGEPATGNIIALYWNGQCSGGEGLTPDSPSNFTARYRAEDNTKLCALAFNKAF